MLPPVAGKNRPRKRRLVLPAAPKVRAKLRAGMLAFDENERFIKNPFNRMIAARKSYHITLDGVPHSPAVTD